MRTGELYQRYNGLYLGTVVSTDDPQRLGRVRVRMDQFEDSDDEPAFASVARPVANNETTVFFSPQVDDQVVVGFLVGDVNEPIILGYAHSDKKKPPGDVSAPSKHGIATRVGSVVFDEQAKSITVTFGSVQDPDSMITMDDDGIAVHARRNNQVVRVNGGTQRVARVDDSLDAGTLLVIESPAGIILDVIYFAAGEAGELASGIAAAEATRQGNNVRLVRMDGGLITAGAERFEA